MSRSSADLGGKAGQNTRCATGWAWRVRSAVRACIWELGGLSSCKNQQHAGIASMTPEQQAREEIDRQLKQCGWVVQTYRDMNLSAGPGIAVQEFPLKS